MSTDEHDESRARPIQDLIPVGQGVDLALQNAIHLWASATTDAESLCRVDLLRAKGHAAVSFFAHARKSLAEVGPVDVEMWRKSLEADGFKSATVYARLSRLSSFFEWVLRDPMLGQFIQRNPVPLVRPKAPRAYQTESTKSLDDEQVSALIQVVRDKARTGDVVGQRDYALLLLFITTGMRRREVIGLRGVDVELRKDDIVVRCRVKGGDYVGRSVNDPLVREALLDYLGSCARLNVLGSERPLWTRHDRAGRPGAPLTSHAFDKNLKRYAREAGIGSVHIHQTRHTFARIVSEETGSITETQDALGHKNLSTTRVYIGRIAVKRDKHSRHITARLNVSSDGQKD
jgi:integrase